MCQGHSWARWVHSSSRGQGLVAFSGPPGPAPSDTGHDAFAQERRAAGQPQSPNTHSDWELASVGVRHAVQCQFASVGVRHAVQCKVY
jgi:hypothetical protein